MNFEEWLRTVCFQKPTPEAYDLAKCAYNFAIDEAVKIVNESYDLDDESRHKIAFIADNLEVLKE